MGMCGKMRSIGTSHLRWGQRLAVRSHRLLWVSTQTPAVGPAARYSLAPAFVGKHPDTCGGASGSLFARKGFLWAAAWAGVLGLYVFFRGVCMWLRRWKLGVFYWDTEFAFQLWGVAAGC